MGPLIIDSFAGSGGASEGIRAALGRDLDFALNHDRIALAMHRMSHPDTQTDPNNEEREISRERCNTDKEPAKSSTL